MPEVGKFGKWARHWAPEAALAVLAGLVFLGGLGSMDLWGKREQRAVAESIDTVDQGHWLVAEIQGRPRLEKPPLPRWTTATLISITGRRDQWLVRLPSALSAIGMVGLAYGLGRRIGGRSVGLATGLALTSIVTFIIEMRQAGNDGPLAFFTTLAIYAAWRRLHSGSADGPPGLPGESPGQPRWATLMYGAIGLGFLCKGPVVLLLVALALLPYLACSRRLKVGGKLLWNGWGLVLFLGLVLSWPLPVVLNDSNAVGVWLLEMGQKAGGAGITHHKSREILATEWPGMTAPWTFLALLALALPFLKQGRSLRPAIWLPWWWAVGNLGMFCLWSVAKPNYYLPCLPAVAILIGIAWVHVCRLAREPGLAGKRAGRFLRAHWIGLLLASALAPVIIGQKWPDYLGWTLLMGGSVALGVIASLWAWRRGADAMALAPLVGSLAVVVLAGYMGVAPRLNGRNSHRALANELNAILPAEARTVMFFRELDEGLWFYLRDRELKPVPGSEPRYNSGYDLLDAYKSGRLIWDKKARMQAASQTLVDWFQQTDRETPYVLIRADDYDLFADEFAQYVTPLYREPEMDRNELMLLQVKPADSSAIATVPKETPSPERR